MLKNRKYKSGSRWALWRWSFVDAEYIIRLHLIKTPLFAICLHWLVKPDPEPYLHDHPVSFLSLILRGWYVEQRLSGLKYRKWFNFIGAKTRHRILMTRCDTLTICFMGPKTREWGFWVDGKWVYWKDYNKAKYAEPSI